MTTERTNLTTAPGERCDIKIWSGDCERSGHPAEGEKYLCVSCGTIVGLDHEVTHDIFPSVSGDYDKLI
ncbi:hypothetical protein FO488_04735 [Geobacter sp. FeAm09]|uniref:hypothetical protein n=1 Tax=Geobacter sp. FeAm09 TaxID=2597769 RepID=UPI0011ED55D9|nr:hypothetical protein [Geobacter sp. FeAm09]QEM67519.1 hypothetical protein FO488_04735 [Geobacter sp. FeAm09]